MTRWLRPLLKLAGKSERKVIAVFGFTPQSCDSAVLHLWKGAPEVPVWLFCTSQPWPETAARCERVYVGRNSLALLLRAEFVLWRRSVALSVAAWTGEHGRWFLKAAPFMIPPFRALVLNSNNDFFAGTPSNVLAHYSRKARDLAAGLGHHLAGLLLLALATILRFCGSPHRQLFHWLHGDRPLKIRLSRSHDSGVGRWKQNTPGWNGPVLEQFLKSSDKRWILWQEDGTFNSWDEMLPLFADELTFAVSRQEYYRGWQSMTAPAAAFRRLEPGEASQVLAPVSGTILVDRRKLLALGIPRCDQPLTAWLLLFWKAAAAGFRSYSIGQNAHSAALLAAFPVQETAFVLRVLLQPALRRLGPREPELSRGTIAFRPTLKRSPSTGTDRLKVLIVSPFLPYPLSHGGAVRIYNLCSALSDRVEFALAAIHEQDEAIDYEKLHEVFRHVHIVDVDEFASKDEALPAQVRRYQSRSLQALIARIRQDWEPDLIQIEYTVLAEFRESAGAIPAILVEHDVTFGLYRQLAANQPTTRSRDEFERWRTFEQQWLPKFDAVWTVSNAERSLALRAGSHPDRTLTVPNGVDIQRFVPREDAGSDPRILYVGSFRHLPNVLGFETLRQEIMPQIWKRIPDAQLRVVAGPGWVEYWREHAGDALKDLDERIDIQGFVEDLRPVYADAAVVAVPLEVSAGTNIKVLEAMACGKAVVTTPVGCMGLGLRNEYDAFIRGDWEEFARTVCDLLSDARQRRRVGARARSTVEDRFSWKTIADCAYRSYSVLAGSGTPKAAQL